MGVHAKQCSLRPLTCLQSGCFTVLSVVTPEAYVAHMKQAHNARLRNIPAVHSGFTIPFTSRNTDTDPSTWAPDVISAGGQYYELHVRRSAECYYCSLWGIGVSRNYEMCVSGRHGWEQTFKGRAVNVFEGRYTRTNSEFAVPVTHAHWLSETDETGKEDGNEFILRLTVRILPF